MPIIEEKVDGHLKTVLYEESPIMSTYLVAIFVGLFDYIEDHTSDGVKVWVYCQVGKANQGAFALNFAVNMVAIPDFFGAMENYGLVTYREMLLLFDEHNSSAANKQMVATVVAHELAHQWFGNLVTMEWWTDLWLNEAFASWVSYLDIDILFPEWKIWTQFLRIEVSGGLKLDGLEESHANEVDINRASESLASYIKKYASSNAKTEDLWAALEEGSDEPVNKLMNSWTQQKGYPVISVKVKHQKLEFYQTQFYLSGSQGNGQWIVPIILCCGSYDARRSFLLRNKSETLDVKEVLGCSIAKTRSSWIKVNVYQTGFYRVKYDEELLAALGYAIEKKHLSATDRFGILDASFALSTACLQSFASLLTLLGAYREIAADAVPDLLDLINQLFLGLFQYCAEKLGWEPKPGESHLDVMLREEVLIALAVFGHGPTINEASRRFHEFLDDRNTINMSNRWGYESLLRVYRETDLSEEKSRILRSLASCPDPNITLEVLNFLLTSEVRRQDASAVLSSVSREGRETAWTWLKDREHISKTWCSGFLITQIVSEIVSPLASFEKVKDVDEFFKVHCIPSITRTLKQSVEWVRIKPSGYRAFRVRKILPMF
ncbi:aminopeptidase M1-like [Pyrus ussuriensis x Pyrus communis]|uniref:Alpha-aminoacylpeptide hydrolase n=1 Tax=Pyrus ussuriensis x Pyrus communis TaxID=2448454 RepID=A0A5N5GZP1_9ROSA|nr:aminopeptidase M1-like [Pyrus ussuriensis x Pyrus communis]